MDTVPLLVEYHEHGVSETSGILEIFHRLGVLVVFGIVDVDINEVFLDGLMNSGVGIGKLCEEETPRTPVAAHLAKYIFAFVAGLL